MADIANNLDDLYRLAGLSISADTNAADTELAKTMKEAFKITAEKVLAETREKAKNDAEFRAFEAAEQAHNTESRHRVEVLRQKGIDVYKERTPVDINNLLANLETYVGPKSDARKANELSKNNYAAYRFLQERARSRGIRC